MKKYVFGIDVGGTSIKIGLFSLYGDLVETWSIRTNKKNSGGHIVHDIYMSIKKKGINFDEVLGYGFGVPGPVVDGIVVECVNLGWKNFDLKESFLSFVQSGLIYVENDANVATLGETWKGAGKAYENCAMITLGTGVGGGVVSNSRIVDGGFGAAGEIGHLKVDLSNLAPCNCGGKGCLETVASATGIKRLYKQYMEESGVDMSKVKPSAKRVMDIAKDGDPVAMKTMEDVFYYLGYACHVLSIVTNPDVIIFGGGVSKAGEYLTSNVYRYFTKFLFNPVKDTRLVLAELGNEAGMYGAAWLVVNNG